MATPSLAMIPSAIADAKVFSVLPNNGDGDFTFNRDSSATRVGQNGLIQTVGYFGSELVVNGDFATDSDWTKGTGWTISGGKANCNSGSSTELYQNLAVSGKTYKITFTITSYTSGQIAARAGGITGVVRTSVGTFTDTITANGTALGVFNSGGFVGSIDNVSVKEVTGDQPRLNYDISNGVVQSCPSLLLEPASTNVITYSEDFTQSAWAKTGSSITNNIVISPDGSLNADKLVEDTSTGEHFIQESGITVIDNKYSFTLFAKASGSSKIRVRGANYFFNIAGADFDLIAKTATNLSEATNAEILEMENGWFKCTFTSLSNAAVGNSAHFRVYLLNNLGDTSYTGDGISGAYIWGAQLEALSYATSYIPTSGAIQTRAAESCFGAGTASTFNDSEGVLYAEISGFVDIDDYRMISLNAGGSANTLFLGIRNDTGNVYFYLVSGGVVQSNYISTVNSTNTNVKLAVKYKTNDVSFWVNGVELYTDASATMITGLNQLEFGYGNGEPGSYPFYGKCKDLRVYNEALTDAQLQTLTTL